MHTAWIDSDIGIRVYHDVVQCDHHPARVRLHSAMHYHGGNPHLPWICAPGFDEYYN